MLQRFLFFIWPTSNLYSFEDNGSGYTETVFTTNIINPQVTQFRDLDGEGLYNIILSIEAANAGDYLVWFKNNSSWSFDSLGFIAAAQSQAFV